MDIRIRLRHIRCFLETARAGSLTEAAKQLHVSQPAISKTLRELESILGENLFDRSGRRLRLNQAGKLFQHHAGAAWVELNNAQDAVQKHANRITKISVGLLPSVAADLFPRAALSFQSQFTNCVLRLATGPNWLIYSQLREGQLDLVIGRLGLEDQMQSLTFEQLYVEEVVMAVRPSHPLLGQPGATHTIDRYPLILPPSGALIAPTVRAYLTSIGCGNKKPMFETVSWAFCRHVLMETDAIWFISRGAISKELNQGSIATLPGDKLLLSGAIGISMKQDAILDTEKKALIDCLRQASNGPDHTNRVA